MHSPFDDAPLQQWAHRLRDPDPQAQQALFDQANDVRERTVGSAIHLRGLLELSNVCVRSCLYCGLNRSCTAVKRYRLSTSAMEKAVHRMVSFGCNTVVLQAGEDPGFSATRISEFIQWVKHTTPLAVTLSLGERSPQELKQWRQAGADRYLLRFETSDLALYRTIHPPLRRQERHRISLLETLRTLGYQVGSGVMVGLPGQTHLSLARDLWLFKRLRLDMVGIGPYLSCPDAPLPSHLEAKEDQTVASCALVYRMMALTRLLLPHAHLPSTTALETLGGSHARLKGLEVGGNVLMPNFTPSEQRDHYRIYPGKGSILTPEPQKTSARETSWISTLEAKGRPIDRPKRPILQAPTPPTT
jgi:biotin synthase